MGTLKLLITMPVSKGAYILGTLAYSSISGVITVVMLLGFGFAAGVDLNISWGLVPSLVLTVLTMAGLTMFVVSFAPTPQVGNISTSLLAIVLATVSPVYFTMDQAPLLLKALGYISPLRYAADGITKVVVRSVRCLSRTSCTGRLRDSKHIFGALASSVERRLAVYLSEASESSVTF